MQVRTIKEYYGNKEKYSKEELIAYAKEFYHPIILNTFEEFLNAQDMKVGQFGITNVWEYTDGYIEDGNMIYMIFKDPKDFKHLTYKNSGFFNEMIFKFDEENMLTDLYVTGDDIKFQHALAELFQTDKNNIR